MSYLGRPEGTESERKKANGLAVLGGQMGREAGGEKGVSCLKRKRGRPKMEKKRHN